MLVGSELSEFPTSWPWVFAVTLSELSEFTWQAPTTDMVAIFMLQMRRLGSTEIKSLIQDHTNYMAKVGFEPRQSGLLQTPLFNLFTTAAKMILKWEKGAQQDGSQA